MDSAAAIAVEGLVRDVELHDRRHRERTARRVPICLKGIIVPSIVGPVVIGSVLGGILGARLLISASNDRIRFLFVLVAHRALRRR